MARYAIEATVPGTDASSQMSTYRVAATMTRWVIEATVPVRTLYRGCQRTGSVLRWRDTPSRQRCSIRTLHRRYQRIEAGHNDAMSQSGSVSGTNALSRMSKYRGRRPRWRDRPLRQGFRYGCFIADINVSVPGCSDAMSHCGAGSSTNAVSQMSTYWKRGLRSMRYAVKARFGTDALSRMSTYWAATVTRWVTEGKFGANAPLWMSTR